MRQIKPNIRFLVLVSVFLLSYTQLLTTVYCQSRNDFKWPNGAKAALCLTYDDGLSSHISTVVPILKRYRFKATFYPTLASSSIKLEMEKWKSLVKDGHELGNHTVYHPCRKSEVESVKDYLDLDKYTTEQILAEIEVANTFLQALDGKKTRTFAYPCAQLYAGGLSFKDSVAHYATAARGGSYEPLQPLNPLDIDIYNVPAWAPNNNGSKDLIAYIKAILEKGTLGAFIIHGVGEEPMIVSKEDHETMLKFLDAHRNEIWVTTFQEATDYLISYRQRNKQ
jgi:peptidoglycan/xylan/chitin deacetylase (PgdA/CDA1 family)